MTSTSYRGHFEGASRAKAYEQTQYGLGKYSTILWEVEKEQLASLVAEFRRTHDRIDYLDFASGTGRIITFLEGQVDGATGIEISESMAELARAKLSRGRIVCADITTGGEELEGKYDLITTFRFLLNAEPDLRRAGLRALADRLKDETSWLIFNNHGNPYSHKIAAWPFHAARALLKGSERWGNYMTDREVRRLAAEAGLVVERVVGCGLLSDKLTRLMGFDEAVRREKRVARVPLLQAICVNQMYVARLKPSTG